MAVNSLSRVVQQRLHDGRLVAAEGSMVNSIGAVKMLSRSFAGDYLDYVIRWGDLTLKGRHSSREIPDIDGDMYCAIDPQSIVPLSDALVPGVVT